MASLAKMKFLRRISESPINIKFQTTIKPTVSKVEAAHIDNDIQYRQA